MHLLLFADCQLTLSTADGFFEEAQYRYKSNASDPFCISSVLWWQHGKYKINDDDTITMTPWATDGRVQTQTRCGGTTEAQVYYYNEKGTFKSWDVQVRVNPAKPKEGANFALITQAFDGAKNPPMYLIARPPNMLPTQVLTGTNSSGSTVGRRSFIPAQVQSVEKRSKSSAMAAVAAPAALAAAGLAAIFL